MTWTRHSFPGGRTVWVDEGRFARALVLEPGLGIRVMFTAEQFRRAHFLTSTRNACAFAAAEGFDADTRAVLVAATRMHEVLVELREVLAGEFEHALPSRHEGDRGVADAFARPLGHGGRASASRCAGEVAA